MMTTMETRSQFALPGKPVAEFSPFVDLSDGRLLGMEASVRWEHPEHGTIPGHRLVPWAQKNGEIVPIGSWLAATACLEALRWTASVQVAVKVTLPQLVRGQGALAVRRALESSGLSAGRLTVEVPESAVTDEAALADLVALADLAVELAVFDVGATLSSFEPLRALGVGAVKIDGQLTEGLGDAGGMSRLVVEAVIDMAHAEGLAVLVEGVGAAEQVVVAARMGAEAGQGPFFSPLLDAEAAADLGAADDLAHFSLSPPAVQDLVPDMAEPARSAGGTTGVGDRPGPGTAGQPDADHVASGTAESGADAPAGHEPDGEIAGDEPAGGGDGSTGGPTSQKRARKPSSPRAPAAKTAGKRAAAKRPRGPGTSPGSP
jgi:EAL domain-containing protein (putative c-di-GMP-specific phosphodiesterase class I)